MSTNPYMSFPGITPEEMDFLKQATVGLDEKQLQSFYMVYSTKRKSSQDILLFTLLGLIWIAGIQRFVMGQVGMGILYLLTGGFCWIGTIVDLINNASLTNEYNRNMAYESFQIAKMGY